MEEFQTKLGLFNYVLISLDDKCNIFKSLYEIGKHINIHHSIIENEMRISDNTKMCFVNNEDKYYLILRL